MKRILRKLLPVIGLAVFIYLLFILDLGMVAEVFRQLPLPIVILSFTSVFPIVLVTNVEWQLVLRKQQINVSFWTSLKNIFIGYFYGFITPGGVGAYTRTVYLQEKSQVSLYKCMANVVMFNMLDFLSLSVLAIAGAFLLGGHFPVLFVVMIGFCILAAIGFFIVRRKQVMDAVFKKLLSYSFFNPFASKVSSSIDLFYEDMPALSDLGVPFVLSVSGWILRFFIVFEIAQLFNIDVAFIPFMLLFAVANVIGSLPITIYGLGTREASLISFFSLYGVAAEQVLGLSLFWFIVIWVFPSIIGALITMYEDKHRLIQKNNVVS